MLYVGTLLMLHSMGIRVMTGKDAGSMDAWSPIWVLVPAMCTSVSVGWPAGFAWYVALKVCSFYAFRHYSNPVPPSVPLASLSPTIDGHPLTDTFSNHAARAGFSAQRATGYGRLTAPPSLHALFHEGGRRALAG